MTEQEPFCTKQNTSTEKGTILATRPSVLCHVYRKLTPISPCLMSGPYRCHNDLILLQVCQRNIALFNLYASWILPFRRRRIHLLLKRVFYRAMVPVQLCGKHCGPFCGVWSGSVFFFFLVKIATFVYFRQTAVYEVTVCYSSSTFGHIDR